MSIAAVQLRNSVLIEYFARTPIAKAFAMLAAIGVIAVTAQVAVPLPFTPVPLTGSTFGVLVTSATLGPGLALSATLGYLLLGVVGLPVFQAGNAGLTYVAGTTGGYLVGFVAASAIVGLLARAGAGRSVWSGAGVFAAGSLIIYLFGVLWLAQARETTLLEAIRLGMLPFLVGDAIKVLLGSMALTAAWRWVHSRI